MSLKEKIKSNQRIKNFVHFLLIPRGEARARTWVRWAINPFFHVRKKGAIIRSRVRMDVVPFNYFEIGEASIIEDFSTINNGVGSVIIGNGTLIGMSNVIIGPVNIGNNIIMAQHVVISGLNHNYEMIDLPIVEQNVSTKLITIEDDCWIGANVVITAGVHIGKHAVVAGGSVVTKNVPAYSVVVGNPARIIKKYDFEKKQWVRVSVEEDK